ncbi:putative pectinesterase/pectinesterase inhibitor 6 [Hibiscus syriacus]|uniref:Pectinesterase n=1 Tax=Hibiscus syriacus TaxID=106335 RepID=A0A6A3BNI2_HIBSY|nr:pectinesterase-like [Hibiscus syriacus]KAE8716642.1 putative pectinesterase/pectinesterase inhibitor 6 [Hibiscus syriacus]
MDKLVLLVFSLAHIFIFPSGYFVNGVSITFCTRTPYPDVCNHYIGNSVNVAAQLDQTRFSFRDVALQVTLNQAVQAHRLISSIDSSSFDERARLAWNDCLELYEDTIRHLNQSTSTTDPIDSQTWLSASIANQQTCQNGFIDFNLASHLQTLPPMLGNFTKLISNSLAINKATSSSHSNFAKQGGNRRLLSDGFPAWLSAADRKLLQSSGAPKADIVVAQDGSGNFKTITEAVAAAGGGKRTVIYVKSGVYKESVDIKKSAKNIMLIGDGIDSTIVTGSKNAQTTTTFRSATVGVSGDGFVARDITFENTAGPQNHQAVALRSGSDFSVFYRCSFKGYQDTLYVYSQRQFYRDCDIYGTVDFIFGDAVAVFQNCNIYIRQPMSGQKNTVTAQGRTDPNENTGIIIHNSRVTAAADMKAVQGSFKSYLGRPWQKYSRTVFMKSTLDGLIDKEGWLPWSGSFALSTLYYAEYMNTGAGASTGGRVKWDGYHVIGAAEAGKFTVGNFLAGSSWIPTTGVPFDAGL